MQAWQFILFEPVWKQCCEVTVGWDSGAGSVGQSNTEFARVDTVQVSGAGALVPQMLIHESPE
ncbi:hypothetical protein D3C72_1679120 [compost metagenome]